MTALPTVLRMTTAASPQPTAPTWTSAAVGRVRRPSTWTMGLVVLAVAAAALTTWSVASASRSDYYAAIAVSMSKDWSNFFFGAMDPAGTVTLDKIPGSYWIPALFVKVFGFSTWAVVLPNALAAVGAALLVAVTARRLVGTTGGLLAGGIVATTPILVAVARSNQPETFFVLALAAAAWAAVHALQQRGVGWLIGAGLFIAAAFQTYMLEAWALWPALLAAWLCTRQSWWRKIWSALAAGSVSLVASLLWIIAVAVIPADQRPFIGSTYSNSPWEMVFGYNGLGRFSATTDDTAYRSFTPPFSGSPGITRLFNDQLAGQIAWLLPAAALAVVVLWLVRVPRPVTVFIGVWLVTFAAMFSIVDGMHQFYTASLALPVALAVAVAFAAARRRRMLWPQIALPVVAAATAVAIALHYGGYSVPVAGAQVLAAVAAVLLVVHEHRRGIRIRFALTAFVTGIALALTPAAWSVVTIAHPSSVNPVAGGVSDMAGFGGGGPAGARFGGGGTAFGGSGFGGGGFGSGGVAGGGSAGAAGRPGTGGAGAPGAQGGGGSAANATGEGQRGAARGGIGGGADTAVLAYLEQHAVGARYLAATFGAQSAATYILASDGASFLPIGGFDGGDAVPTLETFEQLVADGDVPYVLVAGGGGAGPSADGGTTAAQIRQWVLANCAVPADSPSSSLYACGG